jgi:hypothetical protein
MRPPSFSESHIYLPRLPRVESNQKPLITLAPLDLATIVDEFSINRSPPRRSPPETPAPTVELTPTPAHTPIPWSVRAHTWAVRFALHLTLISAFETVFFWLYVSKSEDTALTSLINNYVDGAIQGCRNLTVPQRAEASAVIAALFNATAINAAGIAAAADRAAYNDALLRNSWLYCSAIAFLFIVLSAGAGFRRISIKWSHVVGENVGLVALLGVYELMFFRTVVFNYRATTMEELDQMVVGELTGAC